MRSTIHAVCCGTNRMIVFAGRLREEEKYVGDEFAPMKEESGFPVVFWAAGECVCVRVRSARGAAVRDTRAGREARIRPDADEATRRVRDGIVWIARCGGQL
jgi:hypothetical protein